MRRPALPKNIAQLSAGYRIISQPQPGYFRLKLVKHGPWVPARIYWCDHEPGQPDNKLDSRRYLAASIGDWEADIFEVWERGTRTDEAEYLWHMEKRVWAKGSRQPEANPHHPVDLSNLPSVF